MKKMKCKDLGGPVDCEHELEANTWGQMQEASKSHAMANMESHKDAMNKMIDLMKDKEAMDKWMQQKKSEFDALPDS